MLLSLLANLLAILGLASSVEPPVSLAQLRRPASARAFLKPLHGGSLSASRRSRLQKSMRPALRASTRPIKGHLAPATSKPETDQALMVTTILSTAALAAVWLSPVGNEYWTAACRSAVVAMTRTMGADYATQLGKHKLGVERMGTKHATATSSLTTEFQPDLNRTFSMGMFYGLYYIGPFSYLLTELYPRWFGNDGSWKEVLTKVLVENILWMPIGYWALWSIFKVCIGRYLERGPQHAIRGDAVGSRVVYDAAKQGPVKDLAHAVFRDVTTDFWKKNVACFCFWGPADIFNFKFVPKYDVPTAMVIEGALWAAILGTIEYDQKKKTTGGAQQIA